MRNLLMFGIQCGREYVSQVALTSPLAREKERKKRLQHAFKWAERACKRAGEKKRREEERLGGEEGEKEKCIESSERPLHPLDL